MVTEEEGPFELFDRLRNSIDPLESTWVGRGIRCMWCVSFWLGWSAAIYLACFGAVEWFAVPIVALSLSGAAVLLQKVLTHDAI